MELLEELLESLAKYPPSDTVANPYLEEYAVDNLRHYFDYMLNQKGKRILLVGEAPGHRGCRVTGIPFTSGRAFQKISHPLLIALKDKIQLPYIETESTSTIVWNYLSEIQTIPFFWNSFPFHPHEKNIMRGNRAPDDAELKFGVETLKAVHSIYNPDFVAGIGQKGVAALKQIFPDQTISYIRHPSFGGKSQFIMGMNNII
jgi:uracil-DNA glycosylase